MVRFRAGCKHYIYVCLLVKENADGVNPASEELSHAAVFVWRPQTGDGGMFPQGRPRSAAPLLHMHVRAHVYLGTMTACPLQILQNLGWFHADFFLNCEGLSFFLQRQGILTFLRLCLDWINPVVCWVMLFNICGLYHSETVWLWQNKCVYFNRSLTSCFVLTSFICGHGTAGENPANAFPTWSTLSWWVDGKLPTQQKKNLTSILQIRLMLFNISCVLLQVLFF